nr:MAG TPA: hypothetical protein [Caudoviricetes sp.]
MPTYLLNNIYLTINTIAYGYPYVKIFFWIY